ncbi:MAG: hypothetical protein IJU76_11705 [Desulfovibrionaceae bacterium]|nr:hypothetical protein [Desulfovibrionaceae bacterium]
MNKKSLATLCGTCLLLLSLTAPPAFARPPKTPPIQEKESTELWTGSILTSTFRCGFCFTQSGKARGVLLLKTAFGQIDEYHLYGSMKNGHLDVRHSSGHHVTGHIVDKKHVKGSIQLGSGRKFSFSGKRETNVRLVPEDCAPLPE